MKNIKKTSIVDFAYSISCQLRQKVDFVLVVRALVFYRVGLCWIPSQGVGIFSANILCVLQWGLDERKQVLS